MGRMVGADAAGDQGRARQVARRLRRRAGGPGDQESPSPMWSKPRSRGRELRRAAAQIAQPRPRVLRDRACSTSSSGAPCGASSQSSACKTPPAGPRPPRSFCSPHPEGWRSLRTFRTTHCGDSPASRWRPGRSRRRRPVVTQHSHGSVRSRRGRAYVRELLGPGGLAAVAAVPVEPDAVRVVLLGGGLGAAGWAPCFRSLPYDQVARPFLAHAP